MDKETKTTLKDLREQVDERLEKKIGSQKALRESLELLFRFGDALGHFKDTVAICGKLYNRLSDSLADYVAKTLETDAKAIKNGVNGVLTGFTTRPHDCWSGDVDCGETRYHLNHGVGKVLRDDGDTLKQEELAKLPNEWTKAKLALDETFIKADASAKQLAKHGLMFTHKDTWSIAKPEDGDWEAQ